MTTTKKYLQDYREFHNSPVKRIEVYYNKKRDEWNWSMGDFDSMGGMFPTLWTYAQGKTKARLPAINAARKAAREYIAEQK